MTDTAPAAADQTLSTTPRTVSAPEIEWDALAGPRYDPVTRSAVVFRHADVLRVLRTDGVTFTQQYGDVADREDEHPNRSFMWAWDGKAHEDRRALLEDPFVRTLKGLAPTIQKRTSARLDAVLRSGARSFDIMTTLALVPYDIIGVVLGAPLEDTGVFLGWLEEANSARLDAMPRQEPMREYFLGLIARARRQPRGGLLDHLVSVQAAGGRVDGRPISDRDILASLWGMYSAGTDTTGNSFASLFLMLVEDPALLAAARKNIEIVGGIVEESLRLDPAFPLSSHHTLVPVRFGDIEVPAGTKVDGWISAANRDPSVFEDPLVLRPSRRPNPHLTFGNGLHLCLGAPLARLELREMLRVLLARWDEMPRLRWDPERGYDRRAGIVHRFTQLHFAFG